MGIICAVAGHRRKQSVWNDGLDFRSSCRRCGKAMVKDGVEGVWRLFDEAGDFDPARQGKPERA